MNHRDQHGLDSAFPKTLDDPFIASLQIYIDLSGSPLDVRPSDLWQMHWLIAPFPNTILEAAEFHDSPMLQ